jgi:Kef-type K+ transport system membrane component KefB
MSHAFFELTAVLVLAAAAGAFMQALRLPSVLGYIATGMVVGPLGLVSLNSIELLDGLAEIGIASLLFLVGMEMRMDQIKEYGRAAVATGLGQIAFTTVVGYALTRWLGFGALPSIYIAIALTFSSTIIVIKLLSEKNALETHYGRLVVGFLLVQDFVALGFLILLSSIQGEVHSIADIAWTPIFYAFAKGTLLLIGALLLGKHVIPKIMRWSAHSPEVLFLVSLAWGMGLAAFAAWPAMGLTIEIGAFMAGLALADTLERHQVMSRVKPLRDFFIVMFFVVLGSKTALGNLSAVAGSIVTLSLFVFIGNPLLMMIIMGALKYRSRISFLTSVTVAQVSEFSLILMALGYKLGHVDANAVTLVTAVGIVTIAMSSFLILRAESIYPRIQHLLQVFESRDAQATPKPAKERSGHVVLIGCHRIGHNILRALEGSKKDFAVIDLDASIVAELASRGISAVYGDVADPEVREAVSFDKARLIISTIPDQHAAFHALRMAKVHNKRAKVVLTAQTEHDAVFFYREGADYVILPHFMSGLHVAHIIEKDRTGRTFGRLKKHDLALLEEAF